MWEMKVMVTLQWKEKSLQVLKRPQPNTTLKLFPLLLIPA